MKVALLAYDTGIAPNDLLSSPPEMLTVMLAYREALLAAAKRKG